MLGPHGRPVAAALSLAAALAVSACGDSSDVATEPTGNEGGEAEAVEDSADAPVERSFEGAFLGSKITTESTVPADTSVGEEIEMGFFLTCADDACAQVYQRSNKESAFGREGGTWLFERDGDVLVARDVRTGPCEGDEEGEYRQVLDWTWNVEADGSMTGQLDQQFTGCGRDATSTTETTMDGDPAEDGKLVYYLQGQDRDELTAAIASYDEAFAVVNGRYQECETKLYGEETVSEGGQCFGELLDVWVPALRDIDAFITAGPPDSAVASCKAGWEAVPSAEEVASAAEQARVVFATVSEEGGSYDPAIDHLQETLGHNEEFQPGQILLAYMCVSPTDTAELGDDGRLAIDTGGILVPHAEN